MKSTMQDYPLTVSALLAHGRSVHGRSEVITADGGDVRRASFAQVAERTSRLASVLRRLGLKDGDRVGTFCWNIQEHLEAYLAVPAMGAVLHTINVRLFPSQIVDIINHAQDRIVLLEENLAEIFAPLRDQLKTVEQVIVIGDAAVCPGALCFDQLLADGSPDFAWPLLDERAAAAMCYTSGTTGQPKGVVYSHRSIYLHSLGILAGGALALSDRDRILPIVPMFHASAWGLPYAAWLCGADLVLPGRFVQAHRIASLIEREKVTFAAAVPTVWNDLLHAEREAIDLSSLRAILCGGAAVPLSLMQHFEQQFGVPIIQAWGLTETSPLAAFARPPKDCATKDEWSFRTKAGRVVAGVEIRITAPDGATLLPDGKSVGEIEARGPWVTAAYHLDDTPEKFHDGWLRTGDVGSLDDRGFIQITDRAKDVIKSGGEWISSVDLENAIVAHPSVAEAAVIGVPDDRWQERPLACVVLKKGMSVSADELRAHLSGRVARWWLPERWTFIAEVPRTSVGKYDKKKLRSDYALGELKIIAAS